MRKTSFWHLATVTALVASGYGCSPEADPAEDQSTVDPQTASVRAWANQHKGVTPWRDPNAAPITTAAAANLQYYGGRVISNIDIHPATVGTVSSVVVSGIQGFYQAATNSEYWTWLTEYNTTGHTPGTNQVIGHGSAPAAPVTLPGLPTTGTIDDSQIKTAISAAITAGTLPAPTHDAGGNTNTYYPVFFGPGITITMGGSSSCVAGGFCAYHGTVAAAGARPEYYYAVQPHLGSGGCATGCGGGNEFQRNTSVASHELTEATTDAEVGLATVIGLPLAWYDTAQGEIGDICNAQQGTITVGGTTYTVQKEWSNQAGACIVSKGVCMPNCTGKMCGNDGCGGSCGMCPAGQSCDANGHCQGCTPNCTGKMCGSDGCGGNCGTCPAGQTCDANGHCGGCMPQCTGKMCGSDGCGGSCGTCQAGQTCDANGHCQGGGGTCKHSECKTGSPLKKTCNACVTKVCKADPFCCIFFWDSICVGEVPQYCGETCQ